MTALQPRTREAVLQIAAWQLGVLESPAGSNAVKYNEAFYGRKVAGNAYPWCLTFVWWVFREAGFSLARTASCSELRRRYQAAGQWVTEGYRPGDILLFDFSGRRAKTEHAGILERLEPDGTLVTLEGGQRRQRRRGAAQAAPTRSCHRGLPPPIQSQLTGEGPLPFGRGPSSV